MSQKVAPAVNNAIATDGSCQRQVDFSQWLVNKSGKEEFAEISIEVGDITFLKDAYKNFDDNIESGDAEIDIVSFLQEKLRGQTTSTFVNADPDNFKTIFVPKVLRTDTGDRSIPGDSYEKIIFKNQNIRTLADQLEFAWSLRESDRVLNNDTKNKLVRVLDTLHNSSNGPLAIDQKVLSEAARTQTENYLSIFKLVWDGYVWLYEFFDTDDDLSTATFVLPRDLGYRPARTKGDVRFELINVQSRMTGNAVERLSKNTDLGCFVLVRDLSDITEFTYKVRLHGRYVNSDFVIQVNRTGMVKD